MLLPCFHGAHHLEFNRDAIAVGRDGNRIFFLKDGVTIGQRTVLGRLPEFAEANGITRAVARRVCIGHVLRDRLLASRRMCGEGLRHAQDIQTFEHGVLPLLAYTKD